TCPDRISQIRKEGNDMDPRLRRTASQSQNGCGLMGKHAPQGGKSNGQEDERIWGQHGSAGVAYRWCGMSPDSHIFPPKCKFSTESAIQTYLPPTVCRHPIAVFAWEPPRRVVKSIAR